MCMYHSQLHQTTTYLSSASRYFCFRISKKIFIEYLLSSTFVNPDRYFSTSSHSPFVTASSKYRMLKKNPDSFSNLHSPNQKSKENPEKSKHRRIISTDKQNLQIPYLWTVSLNFSSSKNWSIKKTSSLLSEDISSANWDENHTDQPNFTDQRLETRKN